MIELIQEAIASYNLPLTLMLGLMLLYWLLVIVGTMDFDLDMPDLGDAGVEISDASADSSIHHAGGAWLTAGRFLGFSQVPLVVWGSFFILFLWSLALVLNYQYNGVPGARSLGTAAMLLIPGSIGSLVLTKLATLPVARLFAAMADADTEHVTVLGQIGIVTTVEATEQYGQLQVGSHGAPVLINARLRAGSSPLRKGDSAKVIEASTDESFYYIEAAQPNSLS